MCNIRIRADIRTRADVSNLVTAVILRQQSEFRKENIIELACHYLTGALCNINTDELSDMVSNHLDLYCRNSELKCQNGKYKGVLVR